MYAHTPIQLFLYVGCVSAFVKNRDYHLQGLGFINVRQFRRGGGLLQLSWASGLHKSMAQGIN